MKLLLLSLLLVSQSKGHLVFLGSLEDLDEELVRSRVDSEAELVSSDMRPSDCPGVEMKVETKEFFTVDKEGGEEEAHIVEISTLIDIILDTDKIKNIHEPWIQAVIYIRPYLNCFEQEDDFLITQLKETHLHPPSREKYNFSSNPVETFGQFGQPVYLDMVIFKGEVKDGFFIEAGADDFETHSNTLLFEMEHNWSGLLVEPNPTIYPKGLLKHRNAWASTSCLGTQKKPHNTQFTQRVVEGGMAGIVPEKNEDSYEMQCFPLYSLLMAVGTKTVNYLSLDIEGAEFLVLQTIPWDKVDIEVISLETNHAGEVFPGTQEEVRQYLSDQGYVLVHTVAIDDIFVRRDLYDGKYAPDREAEEKFYQLMKQEQDSQRKIEDITHENNLKIEL